MKTKEEIRDKAKAYVKTLPGINYKSLYDFGTQNITAYEAGYTACQSEQVDKIINYIENEAAIMVPIEKMFNEDKTHITKKQYGIIVLQTLCEELREIFRKDKGLK